MQSMKYVDEEQPHWKHLYEMDVQMKENKERLAREYKESDEQEILQTCTF